MTADSPEIEPPDSDPVGQRNFWRRAARKLVDSGKVLLRYWQESEEENRQLREENARLRAIMSETEAGLRGMSMQHDDLLKECKL